jgi:hypothetical protein
MLAYMNDASNRRTPIQHFGRRSRLSPKVQRNSFLLLSSPLTTAIGTLLPFWYPSHRVPSDLLQRLQLRWSRNVGAMVSLDLRRALRPLTSPTQPRVLQSARSLASARALNREPSPCIYCGPLALQNGGSWCQFRSPPKTTSNSRPRRPASCRW